MCGLGKRRELVLCSTHDLQDIAALISDFGTITARQEAVAELLENEEVFFSLQSVLGRFLDVDHLLSLCVQVCNQQLFQDEAWKFESICSKSKNQLMSCNSDSEATKCEDSGECHNKCDTSETHP